MAGSFEDKVEIRELMSLNEKLNWLNSVYPSIPVMANYRDLMLEMKKTDWDKYRVFAISNGARDVGFGGISPENNFNVYATSDDLSESLIRYMMASSGARGIPNMMLGPVGNEKAVQAIEDLREIISGRYHYHHLEISQSTLALDLLLKIILTNSGEQRIPIRIWL